MAQKLFPERAETPSVMLSPNFPSERLSAFTYAEEGVFARRQGQYLIKGFDPSLLMCG